MAMVVHSSTYVMPKIHALNTWGNHNNRANNHAEGLGSMGDQEVV